MGVYDQAARAAARAAPEAVVSRVGELAGRPFRFGDWADTRTVPPVAGRDQTADCVAVMEEVTPPHRPWLGVLEFQSAHDADKLDDLLAEAAQYRRTLRLAADGGGKYAVLPVLVYLRGDCPEDEATLDMTVAGGRGIRHAPVVWAVGNDSAAEALEAVEQGQRSWGTLFWVPLMAGADEDAVVTRWRALVDALTEPRRADVTGVGLVFAELAGRGQVWHRVLEEWKMTESPLVNKWMEQVGNERELKGVRESLLRVLGKRFAGAVPPEVVETIKAQPSLPMLNEWMDEAVTAPSIEAFTAYLRS